MEELTPSELGTQQYWENRYQQEIANFKTHGDPGEVWFGEDSVDRIITWMSKREDVTRDSKIIDLGCGNGMLLIELAREGYTRLHGVDYSDSAITLAKSIAREQDIVITFSICDILNGLPETYDIVHDKGTYDAVSLSPDPAEGRKKYVESVCNAMNKNGLFVITSCNWTQDEMHEHFKDRFKVVGVIPTPQFKFGGKVGNVVSSVVYRKV